MLSAHFAVNRPTLIELDEALGEPHVARRGDDGVATEPELSGRLGKRQRREEQKCQYGRRLVRRPPWDAAGPPAGLYLCPAGGAGAGPLAGFYLCRAGGAGSRPGGRLRPGGAAPQTIFSQQHRCLNPSTAYWVGRHHRYFNPNWIARPAAEPLIRP